MTLRTSTPSSVSRAYTRRRFNWDWLDRDWPTGITEIGYQTDHLCAVNPVMEFNDQKGPRRLKSISHAAKHVELHSLDVNLDAMELRVTAAYSRPKPVKASNGNIDK